MSEPLKIVFGILTTYERQGWVHPSILQFFADLPFRTGVAFRVIPIHNFVPAAAGRNVFCKNMKDTDADWVCMIDNDMELTANFLDTVKDAPQDAGIVVPSFYAWTQSTRKLTLCWGMEESKVPGPKTISGFHELTKAGTGVIFIRPSVLRTVPYPYFTYLYNPDQGMEGTEDIQFCERARELGIKLYGNAGVTIGHYHSVELASLWKWAESVYKLDTKSDTGAESSSKDAASPAAPLSASASPASAG